MVEDLPVTQPDEEASAPTRATLGNGVLRRIPTPLTPLVGRDRELAMACDLLARTTCRILTLTGPGGVGKTRLALEIAREMERQHGRIGVFVNLAPIRDPEHVLPAIAEAVGVDGGVGETLLPRLLPAFAGAPTLLFLDNLEQVVAAGPEIVTLLTQVPTVQVLVTSRTPLRVRGEHDLAVPTLDLPDPDTHDLATIATSAAVTLFVQRAQMVRGDIALTAETAPIVAEIVRRLDGLPLAIELAAPHLKLFSLQTLHDRLSDRLVMLTGGSRDLPSRLQTMRSAIQWSYDLLTPEEQRIYRRLSLLQGSFSLAAASAIVGDAGAALDGLMSLIDQSLVHPVTRELGETRFRMLEVIRDFGATELRKSGEEVDAADRLLTYVTTLARDAEPALTGAEQARWMQLLDDDLANLRLGFAIALAQGGAGDRGVQLASGIWRYWLIRGQLTEGTQWLEQVLAVATDVSPQLEAQARNNLGNLAFELGRLQDARDRYRESRDLYGRIGDRAGIADELNNLGLVEMIRGNLDEAQEMLAESLAIRRALDDVTSLPTTLCNLADIATVSGEYATAEALFREAYGIRRELGNRRGLAFCGHGLGIVARYRGDLDEAARWFEEGLQHAAASTDAYATAILQVDLAMIATARQRPDQAVALIGPAVQALRKMGMRRMLSEALDGLAETAILVHQYELSAKLLGGSQQVRDEEQIGFTTRSRYDLDALATKLRQWLGDDTFHAQFERGRLHVQDVLIDDALATLTRAVAEREASRPMPPDAAFVDADAVRATGLTRRELEILALLMHGLSDREIAERLYISPRTAMNHVARVLEKLGVNRRTAAASVAFQRRLIDPTAPLPEG